MRSGVVYIPSAPSSSKGTVQALSAPLVPHLLLPDGDVGAIIAGFWVEGQEGSAVDDEGGLLCL